MAEVQAVCVWTAGVEPRCGWVLPAVDLASEFFSEILLWENSWVGCHSNIVQFRSRYSAYQLFLPLTNVPTKVLFLCVSYFSQGCLLNSSLCVCISKLNDINENLQNTLNSFFMVILLGDEGKVKRCNTTWQHFLCLWPHFFMALDCDSLSCCCC